MHPLRSPSPLIAYLDFKSPYAYLANAPTWALEREFGIEVDFRPLTLDIPSFLGSAKVSERGAVLEQSRTPAQWQRVRYAYADAKRYARARGMTVYGPRKIWNSAVAGMGLLWLRPCAERRRGGRAEARAALRRYMALVYERFWRRALDIESPAAIAAVIAEAGGDAAGFCGWIDREGRARHDALQAALHPAGLFGVPSYVVGGEIFFGREHLPAIRWLLGGRRGPPPDVAYERP